MKIKTKFIRIMILAVAAAGLSCGCSSPQKAGVNALEKGEYEEAKAQFEELTKSSDKEEAAGGYR